MKTIIYSFFILTLVSEVFAQFGMGKIEELKMAQTRTLLVVIAEPDPYVIQKLEKKGLKDKISVYERAISDYNDNMKEVVMSNW